MRKTGILLLLLTVGLTINIIPAASSPLSHKGVLDLRHMKNPEHFVFKLNGEWEFYWGKLLHPYEFSTSKQSPDLYGVVPSYWTHYRKQGIKTTNTGYATYRLKILFPEGFRYALGLDCPIFDSSYDLFVDGNYIGGNGTPGKTEAETKPEYRPSLYRVTPVADSMVIIINVANFHHRFGGFWLPVKLGTFETVRHNAALAWASEWSVIAILLGFSVFFLMFYIMNPQEKLSGAFFIITVGLAFRPLFTSHYLINSVVDLNWLWTVRYDYLVLYTVLIGWAWFVRHLYPSQLARITAYIFTAIFSIAGIITIVFPVNVFSYTVVLYYPAMLLLICYLLYKCFAGALKGILTDIVYLAAFIMLLATGIHDLRVSLGKSASEYGYILSYAIVLFVFIQTGLFIYKWIKAYREQQKIRTELAYVNRNLEMLVNERTSELKKQNEEIEKQNSMIASQNMQLSETIQLKNRIFSVIAHDLRSPVVNILYMLNLLKEKEYKEQYDSFANSSIHYAQMVITLLENMLVWGRDQENKIKFAPEKRDLADIILTNLSIFKESSDKKEISVNFTQVGNSLAYFDRDLLDIIIRNLLSNAIKYTPRGGRISILLKDKASPDNLVLLKVCDNGTGITEAKQKTLFSKGDIESTPGTENEKGTGLGLKLCYDLVKINNGELTVESKPGEGTCFTITIPASERK